MGCTAQLTWKKIKIILPVIFSVILSGFVRSDYGKSRVEKSFGSGYKTNNYSILNNWLKYSKKTKKPVDIFYIGQNNCNPCKDLMIYIKLIINQCRKNGKNF